MMNLFPVAGVKHLMVTHVSNTLNVLQYSEYNVLQNMNGTENCYYKTLLKAKLTISKHVPLLLFLQRYVHPL